MPSYLITNRVPDGFTPSPEAFAAWTAWFDSLGGAVADRGNPAFAGTYAFRDEVDFPALFPTFLEGLPPGGLVMCHPGFVDDELRRLDPLTDLREQEYAYFSGDAFRRDLATQHVS